MKKIIYFMIAITGWSASAQVGIGVSTADINSSAQFEVASTNKGFLPPRMTEEQKNAITNPAAGLIIYQTDNTKGLYYFDGTAWNNGTNGDFVDLTSNQSVGGNKGFQNNLIVNGILIGNTAGNQSTTLGDNANTGGGDNNTAIGFFTNDGANGTDNTAVGTNTMRNAGTTSGNTAIGVNAGSFDNTGGNNNTYLGASTGAASGSAISNSTAIGSGAFLSASNTIQLGNTSITDVKTSGQITGAGFKTPTGTSAQYLMADGTVSDGTGGNFVDLTNSQTIDGYKNFTKDITINDLSLGHGSFNDSSNIAFGNNTLASNQSGTNNIAIGQNAAHNNNSGSTNVVIGNGANYYNESSSEIVAVGNGALHAEKGAGNVAVGAWAGHRGNISADLTNSVFLGRYASAGGGTIDNSVALGNGASVDASNTIQLGNTNITDVKTSGQITGAGFKTPSGTSAQYLMADGSTTTSSFAPIDSPSFSGVVTVGGASSTSSAALEVSSTTQGLLLPRMSGAQRDAIASPAAGLLLWCNNCGLNGEIQVYNGTTWTNVIGGTASAVLQTPTVTIGDTYQGGIVAYILQSGDPGYDANVQHGLIVATASIGSKSTNYTTTSEGFGTGLANTNTIANADPLYDGAAQLVRAYSGGGYTDWYLPSLNEGKKIATNYSILNKQYYEMFSGSSATTECDMYCEMGWDSPRQTRSIMHDPNYGVTDYQNISSEYGVLPVRSF